MMKKQILNEKGLTLAELLAALVIGSIIFLLIMSVLLSIQKQYNSQSDKINNLTDITLAAKAITKDLRSAQSVDIISESHMEISTFIGNIRYEFVDDVLKKNDEDYIFEIREFIVAKSGSKISLTIVSENKKRIETEIMIREVDDHEKTDE